MGGGRGRDRGNISAPEVVWAALSAFGTRAANVTGEVVSAARAQSRELPLNLATPAQSVWRANGPKHWHHRRPAEQDHGPEHDGQRRKSIRRLADTLWPQPDRQDKTEQARQCQDRDDD